MFFHFLYNDFSSNNPYKYYLIKNEEE